VAQPSAKLVKARALWGYRLTDTLYYVIAVDGDGHVQSDILNWPSDFPDASVLAKMDNLTDPHIVDILGITSITTLIDKVEFTYNDDGDIETIIFKKDSGATTVFTLTFAYDEDTNLESITRS